MSAFENAGKGVALRVVEFAHRDLGLVNATAVPLKAVLHEQVFGNDAAPCQRCHDRKAGREHRGGVACGFGDANHRLVAQLARGVHCGVTNAGNAVRVRTRHLPGTQLLGDICGGTRLEPRRTRPALGASGRSRLNVGSRKRPRSMRCTDAGRYT
ncbi:MAG: hypothetical protein JHC40_14860 [Burkholderiales bacterium]|nr:hypothetical protein [Burkholderiales bacterium]